MVKVILEDNMYQELYNFIAENIEVSQPDIIKHFTDKFQYDESKRTLNRVKIGNRLKRLEKHGIIEKNKKQSDRGYILSNYWRVKDGEGFSKLSVKI